MSKDVVFDMESVGLDVSTSLDKQGRGYQNVASNEGVKADDFPSPFSTPGKEDGEVKEKRATRASTKSSTHSATVLVSFRKRLGLGCEVFEPQQEIAGTMREEGLPPPPGVSTTNDRQLLFEFFGQIH